MSRPRQVLDRVAPAVLVLTLVCASIAGGQAASDSVVADTVARDTLRAPVGAPVLFGGDTLLRLYARLGPFSAADRALAVGRRLQAASRGLRGGQDSITVVEGDTHTDLVVGDAVLMTLLDADAAPTGKGRSLLAAEYASVIGQAVEAEARRWGVKTILLGVAFTLLSTLALIVLLRLLGIWFPKIYARIEAWRGTKFPTLRIQQLELLSGDKIADAALATARILRVALVVLLLYFYVPLVLSFFPWTAPLAGRILDYFVNPLAAIWARFTAYLPNVFFIVIIFFITRYLLKFIHYMFRAVGSGTLTLGGFHPDWAEPTYKIVRFMVIAFAAVIMWPYLPGSDSDAFKGISLFIGVLFSLGSSGAIGNLVAGVVLTYTRAFQIGDRVKIGEAVGDIIERTLLVTRLRTIKNVEITIPNGMVLSTQVVNYSTEARNTGVILHTTVTIGYDVPWRQVHELLIAAAKATEHILPAPEPFVLQTGLSDYYPAYEINAYTDRPEIAARTYSALHANIQDKFNEAAVEILSPAYSALRDGNSLTIPADYVPKAFEAPAFRLHRVDASGAGS